MKAIGELALTIAFFAAIALGSWFFLTPSDSSVSEACARSTVQRQAAEAALREAEGRAHYSWTNYVPDEVNLWRAQRDGASAETIAVLQARLDTRISRAKWIWSGGAARDVTAAREEYYRLSAIENQACE